jgi:hypothetical protein
MKSISKPLLLVEIYAFQEIMSTEDFRKEDCMEATQNLFDRKVLESRFP